jgi:SNF2 family DNA or RNA helicase
MADEKIQILIKSNNESEKLKCLIDDIIPEITTKTIIFTQSKRMAYIINRALESLKIKAYLITGDVSDKQESINRFINDKTTNFIVATDCLKEGVNLQACSNLIHFDQVYSATKMIQREGRINRIGSYNKLTVIKIITNNSIEEEVEKILKEKFDLQLQAVDNESLDIRKILINKMFGGDV